MVNSSLNVIEKLCNFANIPAVGYAHVQCMDTKRITNTVINYGKKDIKNEDLIDNHTRFPASSLSKVVFTFLVLQLVIEKKFDLDSPLHDILKYERFLVKGKYPNKAKQLTARHILSHTTGLPNFGSNWSPESLSQLSFDDNVELGEKYTYSGEAFYYLQKVIETKMKQDLETLAKKYVFEPLQMSHSTFMPHIKDDNVVKVHSELGRPAVINENTPYLNIANAAGSLLTTATDFAKFMTAWFSNSNNPIFQQAFVPSHFSNSPVCGLGWHIYKNSNTTFAYQYGQNANTRSFVVLNLTDKKGAVLLTNSEHGMSIGNQIFNSPALAAIGDIQTVFKNLGYCQCNELGWKQILEGKIAESHKNFPKAKLLFEQAVELAPDDQSIQRRLQWFNDAHRSQKNHSLVQPLKNFQGKFKNRYNDEIYILNKNNHLIYKEADLEMKLVPVSETEFVPNLDQSFKLIFENNQLTILFLNGDEKFLNKEPLSSQTAIMLSLGDSQLKQVEVHSDTIVAKERTVEQQTDRTEIQPEEIFMDNEYEETSDKINTYTRSFF